MRLFLALKLSEEARAALSAEIRRLEHALEPRGFQVAWVAEERLHLTLKFLGETADERSEKLIEALKNPCAESPPFDLALRGLGAFPEPRRPRILWAGTDAPA